MPRLLASCLMLQQRVAAGQSWGVNGRAHPRKRVWEALAHRPLLVHFSWQSPHYGDSSPGWKPSLLEGSNPPPHKAHSSAIGMPRRNIRVPRHKATYCVIRFIWNTYNRQINWDRKQISGCRGLEGGGNEELLLNGDRFPFWVMKMFWNLIVLIVAQHCECAKCRWIVHFKMVQMENFMCILP